jgi:tripeptidyl-peptidase-1
MFLNLFFLYSQLINCYIESNIPVYIALKQSNTQSLVEYLEKVSNPLSKEYGKYLSRGEIDTLIATPIDKRSQVEYWLRDNNVTNLVLGSDYIKAYGDKQTIHSLFNRKLLSNLRTSYTIPSFLSDTIDFVEMDINRKPLEKKYKLNIGYLNNIVDDRFFGRESSIHLYNITYNQVRHNVVGSVVEYQNNAGFSNTDLNLQQQSNNQLLKNVTYINGTNDGLDGESELDVQLVSQIADGVDINYYNSPYWVYGFAVDLYQSQKIPDVISMSWGWAEDQQCDIIDCSTITSYDYVNRVNTEYIKLGLRGVSITVSSGDAGSPGRTAEDCELNRPMSAIFPGSSPYVLSVGASYLEKDNSSLPFQSELCKNQNCVTGTNESIISFDKVGWTSGSGFSNYTQSNPKWQATQLHRYLHSGVKLPPPQNYNHNGRAYPDVTAVGHSCPTFIGGSLNKLDGTSCSSPVITSILVLINDYLVSQNKSKLGFVNPFLYHLHKNCPECFNDIINGFTWCTEIECCDNPHYFGFEATKGYDLPSGLGSLNVGKIIEYLQNH